MSSSGPQSPGPHPAITTTHGYGGGVRKARVLPLADLFAEARVTVLLHDPTSGPEVDAATIGLWGTGHAGGPRARPRRRRPSTTRPHPGAHHTLRTRSASLLVIVGNDDHPIPTDLALTAHERALEPKRLAFIDGAHYAPYGTQCPVAAQPALDWCREHLT